MDVVVELVNTGSELLLGRVLNSHQQWLCRQLTDLGYPVDRQTAVPDSAPLIQDAVRAALGRADLVIVTGGLGPTADDLTRDAVARLVGKTLREDAATLAHLRSFFGSRNRPMPDSIRVQALVPEGATVLPNPEGTAPGLALDVRPNPFRSAGKRSWLILLPGPRHELRPMFVAAVVPLLRQVLPPAQPLVCRTLRTACIPESIVEEKLKCALEHLTGRGLQLGYCARPAEVDVRLAAAGPEADRIVNEAEKISRAHLDPDVYSVDEEELHEVIVSDLAARGLTLALAESCTGGWVAHLLTNVPGASSVLRAGFVTYSNQAKQDVLGVRAETLAQHGAVSEAVVREMAEGARRVSRTDYALAITGIAGPDGGTSDKPVGTVWMALTSSRGTAAWKGLNPSDRITFKEITARQALNRLRLLVLHETA